MLQLTPTREFTVHGSVPASVPAFVPASVPVSVPAYLGSWQLSTAREANCR